MNSSAQTYNYIIHSLMNGNPIAWKKLAKQVNNFPNGCDEFIGRRWITNVIDCGSLKAVRWMLAQKIDLQFVDDEGYSVLHSCIDRTLSNKYNILQLLIDYKADINIGTRAKKLAVNGWSPLHLAAVRKDIKAVRLLLKNGANTHLKTCIDDYHTAEQEARKYGHSEIANLIKNNSF